MAWLSFLALSARQQQIINHKVLRSAEAITSVPERQSLLRVKKKKKKGEMKHMGKWSIVLQKFKTHDKIVSIQILSATPKKLLGVSTKSQK